MTEAHHWSEEDWQCPACAAEQLAASEGQALVSDARTDAPSGVPMSGGAEPAGAAKPSTC